MTRPPCPLDGHSDQVAIDGTIRDRLWTHRQVAERYQVSKGDVTRHARRCLAPAIDQDHDQEESTDAR